MKAGYLSEIFVSFQGEGAHLGRRHLFVRLSGCNLRCRYCDTPDSLERESECSLFASDGTCRRVANPLSPTAVRQEIEQRLRADPTIEAISVTGGEPLLQAEFLRQLLEPRLAVPVLLETNGMLPAQLERLIDHIDIVSMDIKPPSNTGEAALWAQHEQFLQVATRREAYVKVLVDDPTRDDDVRQAAELVQRVAPRTPFFLQPIMDEARSPQISAARLEHFFALTKAYGLQVRVVPQMHKLLGIQ